MIIFSVIFILIIWGGVNFGLLPGNDDLFICLSLTTFFLFLLNTSGQSIKVSLYSDLKNMHIVFKKTLKFNALLLEWINQMQLTWLSNSWLYINEFYLEITALQFNIIGQAMSLLLYIVIFNWNCVTGFICHFTSFKKLIQNYLMLTYHVKLWLVNVRALLANININQWLFYNASEKKLLNLNERSRIVI